MNCKRLLCLVLSLALLSTCALAAAAPTAAAYTVEPGNAHDAVMVWGTASELGDDTVRLQNDDEQAAYSDIVLRVTEDTIILDAVTGAERKFSDLKQDEILYAYTSPVMTRSLPPQSNAELILCGIPADFGAPAYAQIQSVTARDDGGMDVLMDNAVILHLSGDTKLMAYGDASGKLEDLKPGVMLLSWYQVVALSYPAQAAPDQVMVFPYRYAGYLSAAPDQLSLNGKALSLSDAEAPFVQDGRLMLPVRKIAETLGNEVQWDGVGHRVSVSHDGTEVYVVELKTNTAVREGDMVFALSAPAVLKNGVTFLAAEDILLFHNLMLSAG